MNHKFPMVMVAWLCAFGACAMAQENDWKVERTKDALIVVKSRFSKRIDPNGKKAQLVEYVATTTTNTSLEKLMAITRDVSNHKDFMDQKVSAKLKDISDNEGVVYCFYQGVWPYPSSDLVAKMKRSEDPAKGVATYAITADRSLLEDKGVKRLDYYHLLYTFKKLESNDVEITLSVQFTPAVQLPNFILSTWFPGGPAGYLTKLIKVAKERG